MTTRSATKTILTQYPNLHYDGVGERIGYALVCSRSRLISPASLDTVDRVRRWLVCNIDKQRTVNYRFNSYELKHIAQADLGHFVSNGQLILAALLAGYTADLGQFNPHFAMTTRSIRSNVKLIQLQSNRGRMFG